MSRDWKAKLKNRIESLERLLAEERQKVSMAEKKVRMAYIETIAPSVSDDIKLRVREKELLQEEVCCFPALLVCQLLLRSTSVLLRDNFR